MSFAVQVVLPEAFPRQGALEVVGARAHKVVEYPHSFDQFLVAVFDDEPNLSTGLAVVADGTTLTLDLAPESIIPQPRRRDLAEELAAASVRASRFRASHAKLLAHVDALRGVVAKLREDKLYNHADALRPLLAVMERDVVVAPPTQTRERPNG